VLKQGKEFYPLESIGSTTEHSIDDITIRLITPSDSDDVAFDSVNLYIADFRFIRGNIDTDYILYRRLTNVIKQPVVIISYSLPDEVHFPYPIEKITKGIQFLHSDEGKNWLTTSNSKIPANFHFNIIGHYTGASVAYSLIVHSLSQNISLNIHKFVLISPPLNPACDDETFQLYQDKYPGFRARFWKAIWRAYLPADLSLDDAARNPEISSVHLSSDLGAKFPPTFVIYTQFDPNRHATEKFVELLKNAGTSVSVRYIEGAIPLVFSPNFRKGLDAYDSLKSFLLTSN